MRLIQSTDQSHVPLKSDGKPDSRRSSQDQGHHLVTIPKRSHFLAWGGGDDILVQKQKWPRNHACGRDTVIGGAGL
jgi:hypothetical protein